MTRLSSTAAAAAVAGAALMSTSTAFSLNAVSSSRRCVRGRSACSASVSRHQPSMVASVPRTVVETGTKEAQKTQRLHVQVCVLCFFFGGLASRVCSFANRNTHQTRLSVRMSGYVLSCFI